MTIKDIKAAVAAKVELTERVEELERQLAEAHEVHELAEANGKNLSEQVVALQKELDSALAMTVTLSSDVDTLANEARDADARADEKLAEHVGVDPTDLPSDLGEDELESEEQLRRKLATETDPSEKFKIFQQLRETRELA